MIPTFATYLYVLRDTGWFTLYLPKVLHTHFEVKMLEGSLGASVSSKTFLDIPNEFRVSKCKQESAGNSIHEELRIPTNFSGNGG